MQRAPQRQRRDRAYPRTTLAAIRAPRRHGIVVLAEEDADMRRMLATALRKDGCAVVEVEDGQRLLDVLASEILYPHPIDLIISDAGEAGMEVLAGLRRADWTTPIIMITPAGDEQNRRTARRLGADAVFGQPFELDDFRTAVHHLTEHGGAH